MSFGFSVGDFIAAGILIKDIVSVLKTSSKLEHQELLLELHGLQRALNEIEHLKVESQQEIEVNAIKVAALTCQYRLDDFAEKIKKYESLSHVDKASDTGRAKSWRLKLQWGFNMEAEVQNLRAHLVAHVGYLNMQLTTLNLTSSWHVSQEIARQQAILDSLVTKSHETARTLSGELASQHSMIREERSWAQKLSNLLNGCLLPQITMLVDLVSKIWSMDRQIIDILMRQEKATVAPDLHHTWFQQPVKFEDTLGRILPINAIILDQFKVGPGHEKVSCGEYELFNSIDARKLLSESELGMVIPGMSITMAFVIGIYEQQSTSSKLSKSVPGQDVRHDASVRLLQEAEYGTRSRKTWLCNSDTDLCSGTCSVWFDISRTKLPRPFRIPAREDVFRQMRSERKWFKNVRLFPNDLPDLPSRIHNPGRIDQLVKQESVIVPTANNEILEQSMTQSAASEALLSCPRTKISQDTAAKAISAIARICGVTLEELRSICGSGPDLSDSLGVDSLMFLEIKLSIRKLGVEIPRPADRSNLGTFIESFILEHIDTVDRVGS